MDTRLIIGIIILIMCCILAFMIPKFWNNNCEGDICPPPERRNNMLDWLANLAWYWIAAGIGVIAYLLWYFVGE